MQLMIFLPLLYLLIGYYLFKFGINLRNISANILINFLIPILAIYYISTGHESTFSLIIYMVMLFVCIIPFAFFYTRNKIKILLLVSMNIGWFGIPIATAIFGQTGTLIFTGLYIGNSLLVNTIGASLIASHGIKGLIITTIKTPTFIGIIIGLILLPWGDKVAEQTQYILKYIVFLVGFLGMFIVGQWIATVKFTYHCILSEIKPFVYKTVIYMIVGGILLYISTLIGIDFLSTNWPVFILLTLMPYAGGIINLETYYLKTGTSTIYVAVSHIISVICILIYTIFVLIFNLSTIF